MTNGTQRASQIIPPHRGFSITATGRSAASVSLSRLTFSARRGSVLAVRHEIMSRSYHVTKKAAVRAFSRDDTGPASEASDKAGVKKLEKCERRIAVVTGIRRKNSAIVSSEKALTKRLVERRAEEEG